MLQYLNRLVGNHGDKGYRERATLIELSNHSLNLFYDLSASH